MTGPNCSKESFREKARSIRRDVSQKEEKSLEMMRILRGQPCFHSASQLFCYLPLPGEADPLSLIREGLNQGKCLAAPRCLSDGEMEFFRFDSFSELQKGSYGILEPPFFQGKKLSPAKDALMLVPGMAFDRRGFRLGYGKGYYDRYLSRFPGITVGLCFSDCLFEQLPAAPYDLPVNFIVTEKEWISSFH